MKNRTWLKNGCSAYVCQLCLLAILSAGWWGILYPNFSINGDTLQVAEEEAAMVLEDETSGCMGGAKANKEENAAETYYHMLEAGPGEIKIRSRLWDKVLEIRGKENECRKQNSDGEGSAGGSF